MDPLGAVTDHIIPISKGGSDTFDNVAAAHRQCNNKRGTQLLEEMNLPMDPPVKRESQRKRMTTNGVVNK
jgi:5-methylcytosine-specific restriction endonuclease McrA